MVHNSVEAYEKGYADGLSMAERMRWQGTPIGDLLQRFPHRPEQRYRAAYEEGFSHAMVASSRGEWLLSRKIEETSVALKELRLGKRADEHPESNRNEPDTGEDLKSGWREQVRELSADEDG